MTAIVALLWWYIGCVALPSAGTVDTPSRERTIVEDMLWHVQAEGSADQFWLSEAPLRFRRGGGQTMQGVEGFELGYTPIVSYQYIEERPFVECEVETEHYFEMSNLGVIERLRRLLASRPEDRYLEECIAKWETYVKKKRADMVAAGTKDKGLAVCVQIESSVGSEGQPVFEEWVFRVECGGAGGGCGIVQADENYDETTLGMAGEKEGHCAEQYGFGFVTR